MAAVTNSIVIINFNARDSLRAMLKSLDLGEATTTEVLVVDNASLDGSADMVRQEFPGVRVFVMERNRGFATAANRGLHEALGDVIILCHSDIIANVHTLSEMADRVRAKERAGAWPRLCRG